MATVAEVIDSRAFSNFCGVESSNQVPDGDTLGHFRNILMRNGIQQQRSAVVLWTVSQRTPMFSCLYCCRKKRIAFPAVIEKPR